MQASELHSHLSSILHGFPVEVLVGTDYVEVRPEGISKGSLLRFVLASVGGDADFAMAIGDDTADETMFQTLKEERGVTWAFTATVGKKPSAASHFLNESGEVAELLLSLVVAGKASMSGDRLSELVSDAPRRHPPTPTQSSHRLEAKDIPAGYKLVPIGDSSDSEDEAGISLISAPRRLSVSSVIIDTDREGLQQAPSRRRSILWVALLVLLLLGRRKWGRLAFLAAVKFLKQRLVTGGR